MIHTHYNFYLEDLRGGAVDIALHHACMQLSHIRTLQHEPGPTRPDRQICGLSEPKSQHLYTLYHLRYPAHPYSLREVMTRQDEGQKHECLKLFIQS